MRVFAMVLRGILAIPALAIGLMLHFVAVVIHLATGVIERFAVFAASLLAGGTTLLLLIMLVADKGFITKNWLLWVVMYGGAGVHYILPTAIDYGLSESPQSVTGCCVFRRGKERYYETLD